jgi:hypothetical protein
MTKLDFNAEEYEPLGTFDPLPVGEYLVVISASEMKETKTGRGKYLQLVYDVVDGEFQGRRVFDRLNLVNENETAQKIAQQALSAICRAVGVMHPKDSEELHDKPFVVKVGIRAATEQYQASNIVKGYESKDGKPLTEKKTETKDAAPGKAKKPWEKNK